MSGVTRHFQKWCFCAFSSIVFLTSSAVSAESKKGESATSFEAGSVQEQLELDLTPVPMGMGAIFVPTLTDRNVEPTVLVFQKKQRVAKGQTGRKIVLPPGQYKVVVGTGQMKHRPSFNVNVQEGVTTASPVFYGAVRVQAVDDENMPKQTAYVISSTDGKTVYASGKTTTSTAYQKTRTWFLPEGDYAITLGDDASKTSSRFVFKVQQGSILRYRLVTDGEKLLRTEFANRQLIVEPKIFKLRWVVGADVGLERTGGQLSTFNGDSLRVGVFTRSTIGIDTGNHLAVLNFNLEESWLGLESRFGRGLPLQKLTDDANAELLYNYRLGGILGPYVRATVQTAFFPTELYAEQQTNITRVDAQGNQTTGLAAAGSTIALLDGFNPMQLQQGGGLGLTLLNNDVINFSLRAGVAARQSFYNDGYFLRSSSSSSVTLLQLTDKKLYGAEATAMFGLRLSDVLSYEARLDTFLPQDMITGNDDFSPVYRLDNTVTLSLGRFAALVYSSTLHRDDIQIEKNQFRHNLNVRLQHTLF